LTILVVGNGYDRALNLPTSYVHFLSFARYVKWFVSEDYKIGKKEVESFGVDSRIAELINNQMGNVQNNLFTQRKELKQVCDRNFWLEYFIQKQESLVKQGKDRWVDFETEITKIVSKLSNVVDSSPDGIDNEYETADIEEIEEFYQEHNIGITTYREVHDRLLLDLDELTWLMGVYYAKFVEKVQAEEIPIQIRDIINGMSGADEIKVVSFNYTHFIEEYLRTKGIKFEIDYIHGHADKECKVGTNNMVLGAAMGDENVEFADFMKYFQRILKKTDHKYIDWIESINSDSTLIFKRGVQNTPKPINRVFFFGHSLDLTDGDIIEKLVMATNTKTTVYCYAKNEQDHKDIIQKIKNMQAIISREEVIKRTSVGGTLEFISM